MLRDMLATAKVGDVLALPLESRGTLFVASLSERTDPTEDDEPEPSVEGPPTMLA